VHGNLVLFIDRVHYKRSHSLRFWSPAYLIYDMTHYCLKLLELFSYSNTRTF
jgi:hypothetical protein